MGKRKSQWEISCFGWDGISGVYLICSKDENEKTKIHYIGSSKDIGKRILHPEHPYMKLLKNGIWTYVKFKECKNYLELEKKLIKRLKPELNIQNK